MRARHFATGSGDAGSDRFHDPESLSLAREIRYNPNVFGGPSGPPFPDGTATPDPSGSECAVRVRRPVPGKRGVEAPHPFGPPLARGTTLIEVIRHDIVIVGGGAAGLRAAIAAVEADQDVIQYFVEEAPKELTRLEHWGCPWSRNEDGSVATRAFGGMSTKRTWYAADKVGFHMLHTLFQHSMRFDRIVRYDEQFVTRLIVDGGAVRGVASLDVREGVVRLILGRAVILATGGAGKVFPFTTNGAIKTGDGMALAYREGVSLKDMEFVQYHPTGLPGTGILITEATRGEGGHVINSDGERFLVTRDYGVGTKAELGPRDMISRAIVQEIEAGRGLGGPYGDHVHLDLRHLGAEKINARLPMVRELAKIYAGVDPVHEPILFDEAIRRQVMQWPTPDHPAKGFSSSGKIPLSRSTFVSQGRLRPFH